MCTWGREKFPVCTWLNGREKEKFPVNLDYRSGDVYMGEKEKFPPI